MATERCTRIPYIQELGAKTTKRMCVCDRGHVRACVLAIWAGRRASTVYIYIHLSICGAKVISGFRRRAPRGTYIYIYMGLAGFTRGGDGRRKSLEEKWRQTREL